MTDIRKPVIFHNRVRTEVQPVKVETKSEEGEKSHWWEDAVLVGLVATICVAVLKLL